MEELHAATSAKAGAIADKLQSAEQRESAEELAAKLPWADIHRFWQLLLMGLRDVHITPDPQKAATMALLRLIHAADLPDPATVLTRLSGEAQGAGSAPARRHDAREAAPASLPADFKSLVRLLEDQGKHHFAQQLHDQVGLVRFARPELGLKPMRPLGANWSRELAAELKAITGASWRISLTDESSEPSLLDQEKMAEEQVRAEVLSEPEVRAVMEAF